MRRSGNIDAGFSMRNAIIRQFAERIHRLIQDAYDRNDLAKVLLFRLNEQLDGIVPGQADFDAVVFHVVLWADQHGRLVEFVRAAASGRPGRRDLADLVQEIEAALKSQVAAFTPNPSHTPMDEMLPDELVAIIGAYERIRLVMKKSKKRTALMIDMVAKMKALPLESYNLPDRLHLSDSPGERLAVIVALDQRPDPRYLRWLSERLVVETRFVGFSAVLALRAAAQRLPSRELDRLALSLTDSVRRLVSIGDERDQDILNAVDGVQTILARKA
jgi:hypothetical protein